MTNDLLAVLIADGIARAQRMYASDAKAPKREGAIAGLELCRKKSPIELHVEILLLERATDELFRCRSEVPDKAANLRNYWYLRAKMEAIEWVCRSLELGAPAKKHEPKSGSKSIQSSWLES